MSDNGVFLVTGGAGFLGSNFVDYLLGHGHTKIRVLDNAQFANKDYLSFLRRETSVELIEGSILDEETVKRAVEGVDCVFHLAAIIDARYSTQQPILTHRVNVDGTLNLLEECRKKTPRLIVFPSSNLTYGNPINVPVDEDHPQNPRSPYAASKCAAEKYCMAYHHTYGIPISVLRFSNLYGPRGYGVVNIFVQNALGGRTLRVEGGDQKRTFTYAEDAVSALTESSRNNASIGQIVNIAGPETASVIDVAKIVADNVTGTTIQISESRPPGDVTSSDYGISSEKATRLFGYQPNVNLRMGITRLIQWYRSLTPTRKEALTPPA